WTTDIAGYFVGRAVGGPKLMSQVSPNKTWSGALAGTLAAVVVAVTFAETAGLAAFALAMLAVILSICAQAGDLFESFLKGPFGAGGARAHGDVARRHRLDRRQHGRPAQARA